MSQPFTCDVSPEFRSISALERHQLRVAEEGMRRVIGQLFDVLPSESMAPERRAQLTCAIPESFICSCVGLIGLSDFGNGEVQLHPFVLAGIETYRNCITHAVDGLMNDIPQAFVDAESRALAARIPQAFVEPLMPFFRRYSYALGVMGESSLMSGYDSPN